MFQPTKIVAIGLNYHDHAKELNMMVPDYPLIFLKPSTSVIGTGEAIVFPPQSEELHYEGELAIVIKDRTRKVTREEAGAHIAGYTCANDVTARDMQRKDGQWTRAKSFDTFCPLGPRIVRDIDPGNCEILTRVNGAIRQHSHTKNMIFNVFEIVSFVSDIMTLLPGDVIITGTPPGVGPMARGDEVEVEIEGIGVLRNRII
ncbi:MAG TPA: fumarylacetoacetate hydrolase family protein [Syntrophorhabdaceae bacterium]|jgi:2-keto-4-pentenoate hydratase/2-oxohepta-3-ene-1,7-dioic acid hydratase in catechol pathway